MTFRSKTPRDAAQAMLPGITEPSDDLTAVEHPLEPPSATPSPSPGCEPFLDTLSDLCRAHPTRSKWVFVPSHALGRTVGERLALNGTNWLNLRFVTPLDIALRMGAPFLVERGIEPSEEGLGPALAMRLMLEQDDVGGERGSCRRTAPPVLGAKSTGHGGGACAAGRGGSRGGPSGATRFGAPIEISSEGSRGYFRPLADQPTMAAALWATLRELRMCGVRAANLQAGDIASTFNPAKHKELTALLASYERFLVEQNRADMADVYVEALNHADWCPIQPQDCWTELPDVVWTPLQRRLIDQMPGERIRPKVLMLPGAAVPRRLSEAPVDRVVPDGSTHPLALLMTPGIGEDRDAERGSCRRTAPPVLGAKSTSHGVGACAAGGAAPSGATRFGPSRPGEFKDSRIALFAAGGREAEIDEGIRRILRSGASLDQVEIACASDAHVALVWEKALRHEWPVTLGPGIPATSTRPGRALLSLCDWIETDFAAAHLRHLLQSGDMAMAKGEGFTAGQAARTIARAEAGWGRATYELALGALRKSYESRAADPDLPDDEREAAREKAVRTAAVQDWVCRLIAAVPEPGDDGLVPLQSVVETALEFLEHSTARSSQLDHRAAAALAEHVADLRALAGEAEPSALGGGGSVIGTRLQPPAASLTPPSTLMGPSLQPLASSLGPPRAFRCSLGEALRFLRERVQSLHVAQERPRPGHLYASSLSQAGYSGRPHLFIVGLDEGRVFPAATEDAVLLDAERAAISPALRLSRDRIDEAVYGVLSRLAAWEASAEGVVTFSYSTRDTREFRETYASWLMLQAFRLQQGDGGLTYPQMKAALGEPVSSVPAERDAASSSAGWWMRSLVSAGANGRDVVESAYPGVASGRTAEEARASRRFTEFDGHVPEAGRVLDPVKSERSLSVTDLEGVASCAFRFFLKRGLGLRPVDERERDRDVWLDPLTRGSELHDVYAALLRRSRDAKRQPNMKRDGDWLRKLASTRLAELHREMPAATPEIFERESRDFMADVEIFLEAECESPSEPVALEVSFGRPIENDGEPLARAEPVEIDLGSGLRFHIAGRIDRINKMGPDTFEILDYKTGGLWRDNWKGSFRGGRLLQHALYGLAAVELLRGQYKKPRVTGGVYYFSSQKGGGERLTIPAPTTSQTAAVLGDLRALIVDGAFVHATKEDDCKFCDYTAACGRRVYEQAKMKLADPALAAHGRLAAHE